MKKTDFEEIKTDNTTLFDEIVYISETIKQAKQRIQAIDTENKEITKDAVELALDLYISEKCHQHGYYGTEKKLIIYLLSGNSKSMVDKKFPVLDELIQIYSKVAFLVREEENETEKGDLEENE